MIQDAEISKLDQILRELDSKIDEINTQLLDVISNIKYGIALSEEKKKKGMEIASLSANAMIELQNMKQSGKIDEKAANYMQAGAAIAGLGALLYTGFTHIKEKAQILDYIKQVKAMESQQTALIKHNYDKMDFLLNELQDAIQNKIIKTIDYLSKFQLTDDRAIGVLQRLHGFVIRHLDFSQKYHVFNAYKEHYALYMDKEVFSLDIPIQKAVEVKNAFLQDIAGLFKRLNTGADTIGVQYLILNHNLLMSDKIFKEQKKAVKEKSIKEIAKVINMTKRLPDIKKNPLHKILDKKAKEIEAVGSEQSATKEKVAKAVGHLLESEKQNRKKGNNQTELLLLEYIGTVIYKDKEINKEKITEFDMRILSELVNWYDGSSRMDKALAVITSLIYAVIVFFIEKWLLIFTPLIYWLVKRYASKDVFYTSEDKKRLDRQFGEGTIFHFWILDRLDRHDFTTKVLKFIKG